MSDTPQSTQQAKGHHIAQAQGPGAIATVITNIFRGSTAEQRALRNRQAMLQLVRNFWVKGMLEQSLHGAAMYTTDRIFLRKVGGGYIFVHRLLQEYFASLEDNHG